METKSISSSSNESAKGIKVVSPLKENEEVGLDELWKDRKVLLVFVRHFGWVCTRIQVHELNEVEKELDQTNTHLILIGSGNQFQATRFKEEFPFKGEIYIDQKLESFKAFHLKRGFLKTFPINRDMVSMVGAVLKGKVQQGPVQGDTFQQGGTFLINSNGQVLFSHINKNTGDHPTIEELKKILFDNSTGKEESK